MTTGAASAWARCGRMVSAVVEEVFDVVGEVRDEVLERQAEAARRGRRLVLADVSSLGGPVQARLQRPGGLATGLGLIVAPGVLADRRLHVEWWQVEQGRPEPRALQVDLNPASAGFYDYSTTEWFEAPRRTGTRHIEGPYVDVHGTGAYVFTLTVPLDADGEFLGVAGADVPVSSWEDRLLDALPAGVDAVVLNAVGRVVLSGSSSWLVGELVPDRLVHDATGEDVSRLGWRMVVLPQR